MPPKEEKKEEKAEDKEKDKEVKAEEKADAKDDKTDAKAEKLEVKAEKLEAKAEKLEAKAEPLEAKPAVKAEKAEQLEVKAEKLEAKAEKLEAKAEKLEAPKPDVLVPAAKPAEGPAATAGVSESHPPPAVEPVSAKPSPEAAKSTEPAAEPTALAEPEPAPTFLPAQPFIVFLTPADPIQNVGGTVPTGSVFAPAPRTLFSLSRAPLQVAIAKYAVGLSGRGVGVVGVERHGQHDPVSAPWVLWRVLTIACLACGGVRRAGRGGGRRAPARVEREGQRKAAQGCVIGSAHGRTFAASFSYTVSGSCNSSWLVVVPLRGASNSFFVSFLPWILYTPFSASQVSNS